MELKRGMTAPEAPEGSGAPEGSKAPEFLQGLRECVPAEQVRLNEDMSLHTSFRLGGPADVFVCPTSAAELSAVLKFVAQHPIQHPAQHPIPLLIIGRGSNLIVRDGGIRGVVVKLGDGFDKVTIEGTYVTAEAGVALAALSWKAAAAALAGFEFAAGIPGSLGGALVMNAGAYGGEMSQVVDWVDCMDRSGNVRRRSNAEMEYAYRHSILHDTDEIAVGAGLNLHAGVREEIETKIKELNAQRACKQPLTLPSAGSVFKRPPGNYAGPLIESAGLKGFRIGGAEVSELHANFIVNVGGATAADVLGVIEHVQQTVLAQHGIRMEPEIRVVGEDPAR